MGAFRWHALRPRLLASAGMAVVLLTASPAFAAARAPALVFHVAAQPADRAIPEFARQAGVQIIASATVVQAARLNAVSGPYSVGDGLAILLKGTGLEAVGSPPDIIVIRRIASTDAPPPPESEPTVIVMAQKRREPLQRVPASIQAVSGARINQQDVDTFKDIIQMMSGVTVREHSDPRNVGLVVRGVGSNQSFTGIEPDAAVNIDGEVMSRSSVLYSDINDIESVAVLKGPQGTLFGKNAVAGVMQIRTQRPSLAGDSGSVRLLADQGTTETFGEIGLSSIYNHVLDRDSAIRLSLFGKRDSGWVKNITGGPNGGSTRGSGGRLQYLRRFGEDTDVLLRTDYQDTRFGPSTRVYLQRDDFVVGDGFGQIPVATIDALHLTPAQRTALLTTNLQTISQTPAGPGNHETSASAARSYGGTHTFGTSAEVVHRNGDGSELNWSTFYRDETLTSNDDSLATWVNAFPLNFAGPVRSKTLQSELRLSSPVGGRIDYVAGVFALHSKIHRDQKVLACQDPGLDNSVVGPDGTVISCGGYAFGWGINNDGVTGLSDLIYNREIRNNNLVTDNAAVFAQANLHLDPKLTLTLGGRLLHECQRFSLDIRDDGQPNVDTRPTLLWIFDADGNRVAIDGNRLYVANPFYGQVSSNPAINADVRNPASPFRTAAKSNSDTAFTYKAALLYQPTPDIMTYVSYSTGYKGVAWFTDSDVNQATLDSQYPIPPETSQNFELGLRAQALSRRLTFNATLFDTTFYHYQERLMTLDYSLWPTVGGGLQNIANNPSASGQPIRKYAIIDAGDLRTKGIDIELDWKLSDRWRISANYSHVDARFGDTDVLITCGAATRNGADASACTAPINYGEFFDYTFPRRGRFFSLKGAQLANAPADTLSSDATYDFHIHDWTANLRWNYRFTAQQYTNHGGKANNDYSTTTPAYGIHNLFLGVASPGGKYRFSLYVKNLFDTHYYVYKTNYGDGLNEQAVGGSLTTVPELVGVVQAYPTYGGVPTGKFFRQRAENGNVLRDFSRYVGATFEIAF